LSITAVANFGNETLINNKMINRMKNLKLSTITAIVGYTLLCAVIFYYVAVPKIIERRVKDLDLMQYNGEKDKFVSKDSLNISGWDVYYLQHGNMDGY
jgi:hypothetical protein